MSPTARWTSRCATTSEDEVIKLWQATGSTVIFITHNVEEAVYLSNKCLILSQKPTTVKEELKIDLPRPRDIASPEFVRLREYVTSQIKVGDLRLKTVPIAEKGDL